jgi:hypothetical protein
MITLLVALTGYMIILVPRIEFVIRMHNASGPVALETDREAFALSASVINTNYTLEKGAFVSCTS